MAYQFEYTLTDEGNAYITRYRSSEWKEDTVVVPDSIDGHPVLRINHNAFSHKMISNLYLPDSLLFLCYDSFGGFLGHIHIPYNVDVSPDFAFGSSATVYTAQGSCADEVIKASGKDRHEVRYICEDTSVIRDNDITYYLRSNQTLDLVKCHSNISTLSIPSHFQGYPVKRICNRAFDKCTQLESISFSEGLEVIGGGVFSDLKHLKTVILPESIHTIDFDGNSIFGYRGSKADVIVHSSAGSYAESWCSKNKVMFQPNGTELVKENGLSFLLKADGTAEVAKCDRSHRNVTLPSEFRNHYVLGIRAKAFEDCDGMLETVILEEGIRYIGDDAFCGVRSLKEIILPESLEVIGNGVFRRCNLKTLKIPVRVREIGQDTFSKDSDITLTVSYGSYAEQYCKKNIIPYTSLMPDGSGRQALVFLNGFILRLNENNTASVVKHTGSGTYVEIPETYLNYPVTEIEEGALCNLHIEALVIPPTILNIGNHSLPEGYAKVTEKKYVGEVIYHEYFQGCIKDTHTVPNYEYSTKYVPIIQVSKGSYAEFYCKKNEIPHIIVK